MSALALTLVVYAGVIGPHAERVDHQLGSLLHRDVAVDRTALPAATQQSLCNHDALARRRAARLSAGGVVAGRVVAGKHGGRLRVYLYDDAGDVRSQVEVPLVADALDKGGLAALRDSLLPDVLALQERRAPAPAQPGVAEKPAADEPAAEAPAAEEPAADEPAADEPAAGEPAAEEPAADDAADATDEPSADEAPPLHMGATVGLGFLDRTFAPDADMHGIAGYDARGVAAVRVAGDIEPTARARLDFVAEHSLGLTTALMGENVPTTVTRWEAQGSWALLAGRLTLAPALGVGRRGFAIETETPMRSPDGDYVYLLAGGRSSLRLGRVALTANLRFEPVVGGAQTTTALHGRASRYAVDAGLVLDVTLTPWLLLRADAEVQTFAWRFADGGNASDRYLGVIFSLGTHY